MGVLQNWDSAEGKELWKWEHTIGESHPSDPTIKGMRPEFPQRYPAMLYKVVNRNPLTFEGVTVHSDVQQANEENSGFVAGGKGAAVAKYDAYQDEMAHAAGNRAFHEQKMSPKAQAEAEAHDLTTLKHLGEIPEKPIKRRGRKPKAKPEKPAESIQ